MNIVLIERGEKVGTHDENVTNYVNPKQSVHKWSRGWSGSMRLMG
jgi:hypothetical protein